MALDPDLTPANIPAGTHVVLLATGAVGVVVVAPAEVAGKYLVCLPGGEEVPATRDDLAVRKHVHCRGVGDLAADEGELWKHIILKCQVGSRAYGLAAAGSDVDRRGAYLPPAEVHWSLAGAPEQLVDEDTDQCYWEIAKFISLALKANPNTLECLHSPIVEFATPLAEELLAMRSAFVSRMVYQTYNGYAMSQFKKMEAHRRNTGLMNWKHAMHLIRLLISGISTLREGEVRVDVGEHRERLLAIKRGEVAPEAVEEWRRELHREFDAAFAETRLPERPDYERANAFLIRARRSMV